MIDVPPLVVRFMVPGTVVILIAGVVGWVVVWVGGDPVVRLVPDIFRLRF